MGSSHARRVPLLGEFQEEAPGCRRLLHCFDCGHMMRMPIEKLLARHGLDAPINRVLKSTTCFACGAASLHATMVKDHKSGAKFRGGPQSCSEKNLGPSRALFPIQ